MRREVLLLEYKHTMASVTAKGRFKRTSSILLFAAMVAAASAPAFALGCNFEHLLDPGQVSTVIDARTLRLQDGREIRLAGIQPIPGKPGEPVDPSALAALVMGHDVALRSESDAPDRYGRQRAFVFLDHADTSVQAILLSQGHALASGDIADHDCATALRSAETIARAARLGVWADRDAIKNAERPADIVSSSGRFAVVEGTVLSARQSGATFYINFGRRWTRDFAVTISRRAMASFERAGISLKSLEKQRIRVRGWVERRGGPRIDAAHAGQIELIN